MAIGPSMANHKSHLLSRDSLSSNNEVTFILAVGGVEDNNEFASFCKGRNLAKCKEAFTSRILFP